MKKATSDATIPGGERVQHENPAMCARVNKPQRKLERGAGGWTQLLLAQ